MSNHRHQNKEEQINNRLYETIRSNQEAMPTQTNKPRLSKNAPKIAAMDDHSIRQLAYQIYRTKGGQALDNWLEAERALKNNDPTVTGFISEGNPNLQN